MTDADVAPPHKRGWFTRLLDSSDAVVAELAAELERARGDHATLEVELAAANQRYDHVLVELERQKVNFHESMVTNVTLERAVAEQQATALRERTQVSELARQLAAEEAKTAALVQARQDAEQRAVWAEAARTESAAALEALTRSSQAAEQHSATIKERASKEVRRHALRTRELEQRVATFDQQQQGLHQELEQLRQERAQVKAAIEELRARHATATKQAGEARSERDAARAAEKRAHAEASKAITAVEAARAAAAQAVAAQELARVEANEAHSTALRASSAEQQALASARDESRRADELSGDLVGALGALSVTLGALDRCVGPKADLALRLALADREQRGPDTRAACKRLIDAHGRLPTPRLVGQGDIAPLLRAVSDDG